MALTSCPDCKTRVSDAAQLCPQCGRPMREYEFKWNRFHIAAFVCWGVGAACILVPVFLLYRAFAGSGTITGATLTSLLLGFVLLATGGTLHKIATGREQRR